MPEPRKVAIGAAVVVVAAALVWIAQREPSSAQSIGTPVAGSTDVRSASAAEPAPDAAVEDVEPLGDERAPVPVAVAAGAVDDGPTPEAVAHWTPEQLDALLDSFRGEWPRSDELLAWVEDLARSAVVDEASFRRDEFGRLVGRVEWPGQGLAGEFALQPDQLAVSLVRPSTGGEAFMMTDLRVVVPLVASADGGLAAVQHHPDARSAVVWDALGPEASAIGWHVRSSVAEGTSASPLLAKVVGEGSERGIMIGPPRPEGEFAGDVDRFPVQRDKWRHDGAGFDAWRAKLGPYLQQR